MNTMPFDTRMGSDIFSIQLAHAEKCSFTETMSDENIDETVREELDSAVYVQKFTDEAFKKLHRSMIEYNNTAKSTLLQSPEVKQFFIENPNYNFTSLLTLARDAGGEDLVFPHHENEIAQSEAANGKEFAKYWMHNAFLNIDNRKMSKSLGNFFTVREISEQYDLQVLRFFMLSAHYRSPLNFSAELMEASKNGLDRILTAVANLKHLLGAATSESMTEEEQENFAKTEEFVRGFEAAMEDDFNTADAVSAVFELVKFANTSASGDSSKAYLEGLKELIVKLTDVLGLIVEKEEELLAEDIEKLIAERQAARKEKNFQRADEIRNELLEKGIILEDTREGVKWRKA